MKREVRNAAKILKGLAALTTALFLTALTPMSSMAQDTGVFPDSLLQRVRQFIREGDVEHGRAILDSLVRVSREGTTAHAQALFWRATVAPDSSTAEDDLIAIIVDHSLTPYAADALLRLGQTEYARGRRDAAIGRFERLVLDHRSSPLAGDGWFWLGLAQISSGNLDRGCIALDSARNRIPAENVELLNRVNYVSQSCRALSARTAAPPDSAAKGKTDTSSSGRRDTSSAGGTDTSSSTDTSSKGRADSSTTGKKAPPSSDRTAARRWSAQVGAFRTNAEATALVRSLKSKGYTARVDKLSPLFHVRIGSFATRKEAADLVARLKRDKLDAIVVEAAGREP